MMMIIENVTSNTSNTVERIYLGIFLVFLFHLVGVYSVYNSGRWKAYVICLCLCECFVLLQREREISSLNGARKKYVWLVCGNENGYIQIEKALKIKY